MKEKYVIVCDSHATIPKEMVEKYRIKLIPCPIIIDDVVYHDTIDITDEEVYQMMKNGALPKTSQPEFGVILETLETLSNEYEQVIYLVMSSGFSGTYQSAMLAKEETGKENITVIDSKKIAFPEGILVTELARRLENGLSVKDVLQEVTTLQDQVKELFIVDNLFHLKRLGRIGQAEALLGNTLKIKPVFRFLEGIVDVTRKVRTTHKAMDFLTESILESSIDFNQPLFIASTGEHERIQPIIDEITQKYPEWEIVVQNVNPVITAHSGMGVIAVGWLTR